MALEYDPQDLMYHLTRVGGSDDDAHYHSLDVLARNREQTREPVIALLKTAPSEFTRSRCATVLTCMPFAQVQDALLHALEHDVSDIVRDVAAAGLRELEDTSAVPLLIARLSDRSVIVRRWCAEILGRLRDARAIPRLKQALQNHDEWFVFRAAEALGRWALPEARAKLEHLRDHALDPAVRRCAKQTLYEWDHPPVK